MHPIQSDMITSVRTMKATRILAVVIALAILNGCQSRNRTRRSFNLNLSGYIQWNFRPTTGSKFVQKTVGYLVSQAKFGQATPCYTQGNSIHTQGKPVYIDESTGFLQGSFCWVKGVADAAQTEVCYARGTVVNNLYRTNIPEYACVVEESYGFVMGNNYVQGISPYALANSTVCSIPSTNYDYVQGNVLYGLGSAGYVYGSLCWIRGFHMDGRGTICDLPGTTYNVIGLNGHSTVQACYSSFSSIYIIGNGYQMLPVSYAQYPAFSQQGMSFAYEQLFGSTSQFSSTFQANNTFQTGGFVSYGDQQTATNLYLKVVGYMNADSGKELTFCNLKFTSAKSKFPSFLDGGAVSSDGTSCWISGTTDQGSSCFTAGTIKTVNKRKGPQVSCYLSINFVYDMKNSYSLGTVFAEQPPCKTTFTSEYFVGTTIHLQGSRGFVQGDKCWVEGTRSDGQQRVCYKLATFTTDASGKPACLITLNYAFTMQAGIQQGNGFQVSRVTPFTVNTHNNPTMEAIVFMRVGDKDVLTLCYLHATNLEIGNPHYIHGSTGYFDGNSCWVKGTTNREKGDVCYKKGTITTVYRKDAPQVSCSFSLIEGYDFGNNYVVGTSAFQEPNCRPSVTDSYVEGAFRYYRGSRGLRQGNDCWIQGRRGCYTRGTTWVEGAPALHPACYQTVNFAYILGTGYQQINNNVQLVQTGIQVGKFYYKTVGYLRTVTGSEKTTVCLAQGVQIQEGTLNFIDGSSGYFDRSTCWIKGVTKMKQGESCYVKGSVEIQQRGSNKEQVCLMTTTTGYSIGTTYAQGVPEGYVLSGCILDVTSDDIRGTTIYEHGTSGFVKGNDCWVRGIKDGQLCYRRGTKGSIPGATGGLTEACYVEFGTAFSMKLYEEINIDIATTQIVSFHTTHHQSTYQSVGYVKGEDAMVVCHILFQGTSIELGKPQYVDGSTGFFDNNRCLVKGRTDTEHGKTCYIPGTVKTMYRKNSLVVGCSKLDVFGAVMEGRYITGSPYRENIHGVEPQCNLLLDKSQVRGKITYLRGSSGFVEGTRCWIEGVRADGQGTCHIPGTTNYGQDHSKLLQEPTCYVTIDIAFMMASGFENLDVKFGDDTENRISLISILEKEISTSVITRNTTVVAGSGTVYGNGSIIYINVPNNQKKPQLGDQLGIEKTDGQRATSSGELENTGNKNGRKEYSNGINSSTEIINSTGGGAGSGDFHKNQTVENTESIGKSKTESKSSSRNETIINTGGSGGPAQNNTDNTGTTPQPGRRLRCPKGKKCCKRGDMYKSCQNRATTEEENTSSTTTSESSGTSGTENQGQETDRVDDWHTKTSTTPRPWRRNGQGQGRDKNNGSYKQKQVVYTSSKNSTKIHKESKFKTTISKVVIQTGSGVSGTRGTEEESWGTERNSKVYRNQQRRFEDSKQEVQSQENKEVDTEDSQSVKQSRGRGQEINSERRVDVGARCTNNCQNEQWEGGSQVIAQNPKVPRPRNKYQKEEYEDSKQGVQSRQDEEITEDSEIHSGTTGTGEQEYYYDDDDDDDDEKGTSEDKNLETQSEIHGQVMGNDLVHILSSHDISQQHQGTDQYNIYVIRKVHGSSYRRAQSQVNSSVIAEETNMQSSSLGNHPGTTGTGEQKYYYHDDNDKEGTFEDKNLETQSEIHGQDMSNDMDIISSHDIGQQHHGTDEDNVNAIRRVHGSSYRRAQSQVNSSIIAEETNIQSSSLGSHPGTGEQEYYYYDDDDDEKGTSEDKNLETQSEIHGQVMGNDLVDILSSHDIGQQHQGTDQYNIYVIRKVHGSSYRRAQSQVNSSVIAEETNMQSSSLGSHPGTTETGEQKYYYHDDNDKEGTSKDKNLETQSEIHGQVMGNDMVDILSSHDIGQQHQGTDQDNVYVTRRVHEVLIKEYNHKKIDKKS